MRHLLHAQARWSHRDNAISDRGCLLGLPLHLLARLRKPLYFLQPGGSPVVALARRVKRLQTVIQIKVLSEVTDLPAHPRGVAQHLPARTLAGSPDISPYRKAG